MNFESDQTLVQWTREQPLAVLALDTADRAVLRIAGQWFEKLRILITFTNSFACFVN